MQLDKLHTNQRLLVEILLEKGAEVETLDAYEELLQVSYQNKTDFLLDRLSSQAPYHVIKMTADKHFAKTHLQRHGILTPQGKVFTSSRVLEAIRYAQTIFPVVLKPNWGSHGDNIQVNIKNEQELSEAISHFIEANNENEAFIIESFHPWKEYRLFITQLGGFAVVHREWASIVGDGKLNLKQLIEKENLIRIETKKNIPTSICPIVIDREVFLHLKEQKINNLDYTPLDNEKVYLRQESNLAKGGKAIDMTDIIHPSFKDLAMKALLAFPKLPIAGLDLLCQDITQPANDNYVILEINSNPGLAMHTYPHQGKSRDVASLVCDVMFPDWF